MKTPCLSGDFIKVKKNLILKKSTAQLAEAIEYTDYISTER